MRICNAFITRENIVALFEQTDVPNDLDLLVIDIDGNDYWVWQELRRYQPRVAVIEYNASYPPPREWVMPYDPDYVFDGTNYAGASLASLDLLGRNLGYCLVGCDPDGVNAFFVREDLVEDKFVHADGGATYHWVSPKFHALFFGHPSGKGPWTRPE